MYKFQLYVWIAANLYIICKSYYDGNQTVISVQVLYVHFNVELKGRQAPVC